VENQKNWKAGFYREISNEMLEWDLMTKRHNQLIMVANLTMINGGLLPLFHNDQFLE
jgi:hypothetical protein